MAKKNNGTDRAAIRATGRRAAAARARMSGRAVRASQPSVSETPRRT